MKLHYIDKAGQPVALGKELGRGGEGSVFEIRGAPDRVAKLYHNHVEPDKAQKLSAMVGLARPEIVKFAAWPQTTLHDPAGKRTVGIIMPRISMGKEIHELYSPSHRTVSFPNADWRFLVHAAMNCAIAFDALHKNNVVIGDVNQGNVFVSQKATVNMIDCDSFQIQSNGQLFRCLVGVSHFTPPELQTARLSEVNRTANHDNFGLAVIIFHLLFVGRHPFAGRFSGSGDMPIERAIREYRFAYSSNYSKTQMIPPPNALSPTEIGPKIFKLFEQAFSNTPSRPTAANWFTVLSELAQGLQRCKQDEGHYFLHGPRCPWCRIIGEGGPNIFISVGIQQTLSRTASFNIADVWAKIQVVAPPSRRLTRLAWNMPTNLKPEPLPDEIEDSYALLTMVKAAAFFGLTLTLAGLLWRVLFYFGAPVLLVFATLWGILNLRTPLHREWRLRKRRLEDAHRNFDAAKLSLQKEIEKATHDFDNALNALSQAKDEYVAIDRERARELDNLKANARDTQKAAFLQKCFIRDAKIAGIGPNRIAMLDSYNICTAYDISEQRVLQVPGFGGVLTYDLVSWRTQQENRFRFDPNLGVPRSASNAVEMKFAQKKSYLIQKLMSGPQSLEHIISQHMQEFSRRDALVAQTQLAIAQAECNLNAFSVE